MTQKITPGVRAYNAPSESTRKMTRALLACGVVAGPLFVVVALVQVLVRAGFDIRRHPVSLLSLGDLGWIQITNFVVSGLLAVALAVGMRRVLHPGRGGTWGPLLIGVFGVGLIAGGVFTADPALGFPAGAPAGIPDQLTWHAMVHAIAPPLAFLSLIVACFVLIRRFATSRQWGWIVYSAATGVSVLTLSAWPDQDGMSVRLAIATVLGFAWTSLMAAHLMTKLSSSETRPDKPIAADTVSKVVTAVSGPREEVNA